MTKATLTSEEIKLNFANFIERNNHLYTVSYSHPVLKECFKELPDEGYLTDLVKKIQEYMPNIQCSGTNLRVDIDEKEFTLKISV